MPKATTPCTGVCRIDQSSGLCIGCRRTMDEIVLWGSMSEKDRRAIMAQLRERRVP
ncbi:MAG: DUF1289 domain-containing protein [Novosphingobium sp.]|nr:DUF1289 domain-containing protein [Novosphingobium sp.]|tara:strand:+ start:2268 stop:2435 length:168 start_codon:yes stop_codon:yes gene_type:complete